jgi:hypothetical protein
MNPTRFRLSFNMTLDEQVEDLLHSWRASGIVATQRRVAVLTGLFVGLMLYVVWSNFFAAAVPAVIGGLIVFGILFTSINRRLRRQGRWILRKIYGNEAPIDMVVELTDVDAILRRPDHDQIWHWPGIRSVSEDAENFRLLTGRYSIISLPKRAFRNVHEEQECLAFIRQKLSMNGSPQH